MSVKSQIYAKLNKLTSPNPDKNNNIAPYLADLYFYMNMEKFAKDKVKELYKTMVSEKVIPSDDELREMDSHVPIKSPTFTFMTKTADPRKSFDKDAFINAIADKHKISKVELLRLSETCVKYSKAPLSKSVIEG